jgi:hypothetical protein
VSVLDFGEYKGFHIKQVPTPFLLWLSDQYGCWNKGGINWPKIAIEELNRRKYKEYPVNITEHVIDSFSTRCLDFWKDRTIGIVLSIKALFMEDIGSELSSRKGSGNITYLYGISGVRWTYKAHGSHFNKRYNVITAIRISDIKKG